MPLKKHRRVAAHGAQEAESIDGLSWAELQKAAASRGYKGPRNKAAILDYLSSTSTD